MKIDDETIDEMARDIRQCATVCSLKMLADRTSETYRELLAHKTPPEAALHFFACGWLLEQLDEERKSPPVP